MWEEHGVKGPSIYIERSASLSEVFDADPKVAQSASLRVSGLTFTCECFDLIA